MSEQEKLHRSHLSKEDYQNVIYFISQFSTYGEIAESFLDDDFTSFKIEDFKKIMVKYFDDKPKQFLDLLKKNSSEITSVSRGVTVSYEGTVTIELPDDEKPEDVDFESYHYEDGNEEFTHSSSGDYIVDDDYYTESSIKVDSYFYLEFPEKLKEVA